MSFYYENTNKNNMTENVDEQYRITDICWFCEKAIDTTKVTDRCHLTGKYRGPAHKNFNRKG